MKNLLSKLNGKKTHLGSLLVSLLSAMYFADTLTDGVANWLTEAQYIALGGAIAGFTGVSMRLGVQKAEKSSAATTEALQASQRKALENE